MNVQINLSGLTDPDEVVRISNQLSKVGTTDIPQESYYSHWKKRPWEVLPLLLDARLPDNAVYLPVGLSATVGLGGGFVAVELTNA